MPRVSSFNGLPQSNKPISLFTSRQDDSSVEIAVLDVKKKEEPVEERVKFEEKQKFLLFCVAKTSLTILFLVQQATFLKIALKFVKLARFHFMKEIFYFWKIIL